MSAAAVIEIKREFIPYAVYTHGSGIKDHHDSIFDGVDKPLCKAMVAAHGSSVPGCEDAAAFTSWTVSLPVDELYDAGSGAKRGLAIACFIRTAIPRWNKIHETSTAERREVTRFEMRTAYHERGHSLACEHVAGAISRFLDQMPASVPVQQVSAINDGVRKLVRMFYLPMAHQADVYYDAATGHGLTQGAEARDSLS